MNQLAFIFLLFLSSCGTNSNEPNTHDQLVKPVEQNNTELSSSTENNAEKNIELVFCLDATGSMSGLIQTAKEKIWDIVSSFSKNEDAPNIKLAMIFYRDRGDAFVTKFYPLTENIDSIYDELLGIAAEQGGDTPESVNQALDEATSLINWSKDNANTYKTIFLVGDCPPHMDYKDDKPYPISCKKANELGITINTIKLGNDCNEAVQHFKKIAFLTNGQYLQIGQEADDVVIETPYDDSINYYSERIDNSKVYYGEADEQAKMLDKKEKSVGFYKNASKTSNSSRTSYNLSKSGKKNWFGDKELIQDVLEQKVKLDTIQEKYLPKELKGKSTTEKRQYVETEKKNREESIGKLKTLNKQKQIYITQEQEKLKGKQSFSKEVTEMVIKQAGAKGVKLKD